LALGLQRKSGGKPPHSKLLGAFEAIGFAEFGEHPSPQHRYHDGAESTQNDSRHGT
jgi:hypothetical protein